EGVGVWGDHTACSRPSGATRRSAGGQPSADHSRAVAPAKHSTAITSSTAPVQAVPRRGAGPGPIVPGAVPAVVAGDGGHGAAGLGMAGCCAAGFGRVGSWTKRSVVCSDAGVAVAADAAGEATGGGEAADSDLAVSRSCSPGASPARDSGPSS